MKERTFLSILQKENKTVRECYEQFYTGKVDNLDKMDKFIETINYPNKFKNKQKT